MTEISDWYKHHGGFLERVFFERTLPNSDIALGQIDGRTIYVNHSASRIGKEGLVRVDLFPYKRGSAEANGNYIGNWIEGIEHCDPRDYVLCGLWPEKKMFDHEGELPWLSDINKIYDPGYISCAVLMRPNNEVNGERNLFQVFMGAIRSFRRRTIKQAVEYLPFPDKAARVILAQDSELLERIVQRMKEIGLVPVVMEPLTH